MRGGPYAAWQGQGAHDNGYRRVRAAFMEHRRWAVVPLRLSLPSPDRPMLFNLAVLFGTLVAMEGVGTLAHKYVMHGWGWWLHRSHHEPQLGMLETNDLYLVALG
jgi:hypothetical protein